MEKTPPKDAPVDYRRLYENEQKKVSVLEQRLARYEKDPELNGYYTLKSIINQQIEYLQAFNFNTEIKSSPKEDKVYDRAKAIWEGLKTMIIDLQNLEVAIKSIGKKVEKTDEDKDDEEPLRSTNPFSPEGMADALGELAGRKRE